jgi:hypothetical protein
MPDNVQGYKIGDLLFAYTPEGWVGGCWKGKDYYEPHEFTVDMKIEVARFKAQLKHARDFKERMDI